MSWKIHGKERTMLALTVVLVVGQFVLIGACVLGAMALLGLIAYDTLADRNPRIESQEEPAYAPAGATLA
jgi:hypothetical protein